MCTGRYNSDYGVYVFGGYGQTRHLFNKITRDFY